MKFESIPLTIVRKDGSKRKETPGFAKATPRQASRLASLRMRRNKLGRCCIDLGDSSSCQTVLNVKSLIKF